MSNGIMLELHELQHVGFLFKIDKGSNAVFAKWSSSLYLFSIYWRLTKLKVELSQADFEVSKNNELQGLQLSKN